MSADIRAAFFQTITDAQPAKAHYVSLYERQQWYGGPEEGGWWGSDHVLVAHREYATREAAEAAAETVKALAESLDKASRDQWARACAAECEWLESRGLDADFLPETDGYSTYYVSVEDRPGENVCEGDRYYS